MDRLRGADSDQQVPDLSDRQPAGGAAPVSDPNERQRGRSGGAGGITPAARPHRPARATGAAAVGALAVGACALSAIAIGALAIGSVAVGAFSLRRGRVRALTIGDLRIGRLHVRELVVDDSRTDP